MRILPSACIVISRCPILAAIATFFLLSLGRPILAQSQIEVGYNDTADGDAANRDIAVLRECASSRGDVYAVVEDLRKRRGADKRDIQIEFVASLGGASGKFDIHFDKSKMEVFAGFTPSGISDAVHRQFTESNEKIYFDISKLENADVNLLNAVAEMIRIGSNESKPGFLLEKSKRRVAEWLDVSATEAEALLVTNAPSDAAGVSRPQQVASRIKTVLARGPDKVSFVVVNLPDVPVDTYRTWLDNTGTFRVDAELVNANAKAVQLKRRDGTLLTVPLSKLSEADQRYVEGLSAVE